MMTLALVVIVVMTAFALLAFFAGRPGLWGLDARCETAAASCGVLSGLLLTLVPIAIAVVWLLVWRLDRVRRACRREAQRHADRLLEADLPVRRIVGRDDVCDVLQDDLVTVWDRKPPPDATRDGRPPDGRRYLGGRMRARELRRPVVLVGGVGVGKTAVLARLTQRLAERGAVPVPIRLRAVQDAEKLDFLELARQRFLQTAPVRSEAEGDKIWRRLLENDQIVIVADGLEEALINVEQKRETSLRRAVEKARRGGVAMIVSSRPHEALAYLDGAITKLEPLAPQAALEHILGRRRHGNEARVRLIVEKAELGEMPICMQIARELHEAGRLTLDPRGAGRLTLRVQLLAAWTTALAEGSIRSTVPVKPADRERVVERLRTVALIGLTNDSLEVRFDDIDDLVASAATSSQHDQSVDSHGHPEAQHRKIAEYAKGRVRAAAADAERLGLVDSLPQGLRFRHSILQAYLGSLAIERAVKEALRGAAAPEDPVAALLWRKVADGTPHKVGHELLMALAMSSAGEHHTGVARDVVASLMRLAATSQGRSASKAVSAATAAVAAAGAAANADIGPPRNPRPAGDRRRRLHDAVADLVGGALEETANDAGGAHEHTVLRAWWHNDGRTTRVDDAPSLAYRDPLYEAKLAAVARFGEAAQYEWLWAICFREREYLVRTAAVRALGTGGATAFELIESDLRTIADVATGAAPSSSLGQVSVAREADPAHRDEDLSRLSALACWILPQVCASMAARAAMPAQRSSRNREVSPAAPTPLNASTDSPPMALLRRWIDHVCGVPSDLPIGQQIGFAQGCRDAANLRRVDARTRAALEAQAQRLLDRTPFWHARVALIQALTLWLLADLEENGANEGTGRRDAEARIGDWAARVPHPFVSETAKLCAQAANTGQPAHYIWTDEGAAVARLGAGPGAVRLTDGDARWISDSAGWLSLASPAQRLLADMVVLMNLADRGGSVAQKEQHLGKTCGEELPLCFATKRGRAHLRVERTLDEPKEPGATCILGCDARLCPYPRLDEELSRGELSEAFCRKQQALVSHGRGHRRPSWQKRTPRDELRRFWRSLERRPRG